MFAMKSTVCLPRSRTPILRACRLVVCGTAGPGVVHLFNGLMDARKEGAAVIAIAGDVETSIIDTAALEELNPYQFFEAASLYTGRLINPAQARPIIDTAIRTAVIEKGPTVISLPGDVASADAVEHSVEITIPAQPVLRPSDSDLSRLVKMIDDAETVAIFGGDGCRDGRDEVIQLARKLKAPVGLCLPGQTVVGTRQSQCGWHDRSHWVRRRLWRD